MTSDRETARTLFDVGVAAADPAAAVRAALSDRALAAPKGRRVILAIGKAAISMLAGTDGLDGDEIIVVTNPENAKEVPGARVFAAAHPVPDETGLAAGRAVIAALSGLGAEDQVLALISGGGSALLPAPAPGITLADKIAVNKGLLASGADITEMNLVRQQLSALKGGGLLRLAAPAPVTALILSDVIGDELAVIASGPTVAPIGTRADAMAILRARGIWEGLPEAVRAHLSAPEGPEPAPAFKADNRLVGSNAISLAAMAAAAPGGAHCHDRPLIGDVATAAARVLEAGPGVHLFGGETTVVLKGDGMGGRNQELALRVALGAQAAGWHQWVFLSGGTDGRDGPVDAAGGIVDQGSLGRMRDAGIDAQEYLARNDSYPALKGAGDLLMTGGTGTNVADLQVLIRRS